MRFVLSRGSAVRRTLGAVCAVIGALYLFVTITPVTLWWARALSNPWLEADGEVLILLGADPPNSGLIGNSSYWRAVYGTRVWKLGHFRTVVIAGGDEVAASIRDYMVCEGVPAEVIQLETISLSTRENALFTRALLASLPGRKVLVTSDYHMYRAQRVFRKLGIEVLPRPFPDALKRGNTWRYRAPIFIELVVESAKIVGYRAKGWI